MLTVVYLLLLLASLQYNKVHIKITNVPVYIGRHSLKTDKP